MNNILITGAASGIGAATARLFHQRGWAVGLLDINEPALAALAAELGGAWYRPLDVSDPGAVAGVLAEFARSQNGRLRLLFNCAGILRVGNFEDISLVEHARIMQINVLGLLTMTHAAFPYLKATPGAQVINMGSASGVYGVPQFASYSASKFAVRGLTEALELEWQRHGIRVGDLMPPFVRTPMVSSQSVTPPVIDRLGVDLEASDIAEAAWLQAHDARVHRPVGQLFSWLYRLGQIMPNAVLRKLMELVSRP
ncbi:SDR family oxidoreductase [Pseudomonas sp. N040]|uniref:SDR family oxidoreductase n=1 Tax=Pseudomonas sp. N040 TaxID=2785325 RepID=UPI0018A2F3AB|nr:SDR family oxidoreductase [Pseudomonas sp. N040]MBF7731416.1 SDR family oxidoreductase [Pseudomonas sp. N040]MBW7015060.1 SDR family oxidoreductase [Pseudomonas sp. N040]